MSTSNFYHIFSGVLHVDGELGGLVLVLVAVMIPRVLDARALLHVVIWFMDAGCYETFPLSFWLLIWMCL